MTEETTPTLQARMGTGGNNTPMVAYEPPQVIAIQDGREMQKNQNGLGISEPGNPAYTLDQTGAQAIAIQGNAIGRQPQHGPGGKGYSEEGDPMFTLTKLDQHGVATPSVVRRLTPTECERLQGFPDGWTTHRIDEKKGLVEQADSARYKQMGNAVAVPVVEWIFQRLVEQDKNEL